MPIQDQAVRQSAIPQALSDLDEALNAMDETIKKLHDRLSAVRIDCPEPCSPEKEPPMLKMPFILERIQKATIHVEACHAALSYNLKTIEV
jgi:hypothetical protein